MSLREQARTRLSSTGVYPDQTPRIDDGLGPTHLDRGRVHRTALSSVTYLNGEATAFPKSSHPRSTSSGRRLGISPLAGTVYRLRMLLRVPLLVSPASGTRQCADDPEIWTQRHTYDEQTRLRTLGLPPIRQAEFHRSTSIDVLRVPRSHLSDPYGRPLEQFKSWRQYALSSNVQTCQRLLYAKKYAAETCKSPLGSKAMMYANEVELQMLT